MPYVELHARSAFSFLRAGSSPERLAEACAHLGMSACALCDRDGLYGSARHFTYARGLGLRSHVGCELTLEDGSILPVLVADAQGYARLCRLLTTAGLRSPKGQSRISLDELAEAADGLMVLTGDEEGPVRRAWRTQSPSAAANAFQRLRSVVGDHRLWIEIQRHHRRGEQAENAFLVGLARQTGLPLLATNGVLHATPEERPVLDAFTCLRHRTSLDAAGRLLSLNDERYLKSHAAMEALFADLPEAVRNTERLSERLSFSLADIGYRFPEFPVPTGETPDSFLRKMTYFGAQQRYGSTTGTVRRQLDRELTLIASLGFAGYFLIVWDLCNFAREQGILVQGRGSAANSAVCYALGITAVDPIGGRLLFERFLSEGRKSWPDIDLDLPSGPLREKVIQEVFRKYTRRGAAMTANVITYQNRNTLREMGKVLGFSDDVLDRYSRLFARHGIPAEEQLRERLALAGIATSHPRLPALLDLCRRVHGLPRHLGQHSGGIVIAQGRLDSIVPIENATMPDRSVIQWDKDDCEDLGLVKIDLLGLGMMAVLQDSIELCQQRARPVDLARIPMDDPSTFELLRKADTIGVFQVESRAQMATLPRMRPESFYDVAIEVALIRPGPIHGQAVNPYLERRAGRQPVVYPDERTRPILERTLGVVLFQEQILRIAMELGGFSPAEADELRRAIGFKRSSERLERSKTHLRAALAQNEVSPVAIDEIIRSLEAFALYGFPESHAISFALIAYASAYLKAHRASEFFASLLNNQPMGFYSPATLIQDARRHGLRFLPPCVMASDVHCTVVDDTTLRLGFSSVKGLRAQTAQHIVRARTAHPFASVADFLAHVPLSAEERRTLAAIGALNALAPHRRDALWQVEEPVYPDELFGVDTRSAVPTPASPLPPMSPVERIAADFAGLALTTGPHPMQLVRGQLPHLWRAVDLATATNGQRVLVGGSVICRQRPSTAKGIVFVSLEDETGIANAVLYPDFFEQHRLVITQESALLIGGVVQVHQGVVHLKADSVSPLKAATILPSQRSYDFH